MKVIIHGGDMLIQPETEFEKSYLFETVKPGKTVNFEAYAKSEGDTTNLIGIRLRKSL